MTAHGGTAATASLLVQSDWLPRSELRRLIDEEAQGFETLGVTTARDHRGPDPALTEAVVTVVTTVLAPFVNRLVDRIFAAEPAAGVGIGAQDSPASVTVTATLPHDQREKLVAEAIADHGTSIRISIEMAPA